ncbi:J domain-containing protein [Marilutibacter maris]|uniref:J domain-containing protein n=1 Tax=Marilutibacter maris TaxID=1605891 RepID=UPI0014797607|nr:DnaJ domain-containing protein [Lysobacter maris]
MSGNNYYDILGIRPNAGREEIELAYKGRRSQYHPDRYAQADAETLAWATEKMQQVNEAYQALISPELRARMGQEAPDRPAHGAPTPKRAAPVPDTQDAATVLLKPDWKWVHDKVYARPNIPHKKLDGAISSYAPGVSPGDVIVLLDDTLFGGAKEGLLVTNDAVYCKQKLDNPRQIAFRDIRQVEPGTHSRVLINGAEFFKADLIEHLAILTFASRLSAVFRQSAASTNNRPDSIRESRVSGIDGLWTLHRGAMVALRSELEGGTFLIDELIDRQMRCIADRFPELYEAVGREPQHRHVSVEADSVELALMLFMVLHYYGFSKLPSDFKKAAADQFTRLHEISEVYKLAFREEFPLVFGRPIKMDEEDLLMMSAMFFHRDGAGEFELRIPREEALLLLLFRMGIPREAARSLIRQFEDHAESWLKALSATVAG